MNTKDEPFLGEILIDRGDRFIQIISNVAMEIRISKQPPGTLLQDENLLKILFQDSITNKYF